ncbi:hypothetical protein EV122DRAFT_285283 [Schizophyllum commune]
MDLGEAIDERLPGEDEKFDASSAADTLRALDALWYIGATKKARWMDIIGDYAGEELFVIDGDSLVQRVLDDPLLALGKAGDTGFQTLHALYLVEQALSALSERGCNFEIVFWQDNTPVTIISSEGAFVTTSRRLARRIIKQHCEDRLPIPVSTFADTGDKAWSDYEHQKKPMFVLLNDGSSFSDKETLAADRMLLQRSLVLTLQRCGMPISSFVFEQRRVRQLPKKLFGAVARSRQRLAQSAALPRASREGSIVELIAHVLEKGGIVEFTAVLLYIFAAHLVILPSLSVADRAQVPPSLHPELETILLDDFLPVVLEAVADFTGINDVDGRVYSIPLSSAPSSTIRTTSS